jgi:hypothetical protein
MILLLQGSWEPNRTSLAGDPALSPEKGGRKRGVNPLGRHSTLHLPGLVTG